MERTGVVVLASRPGRRGKGIFPALVIPVSHVLLEGDNLGGSQRLPGIELRQKRVCRRATRTTLRGEEFNNHGLAACLLPGDSGVGSTAPLSTPKSKTLLRPPTSNCANHFHKYQLQLPLNSDARQQKQRILLLPEKQLAPINRLAIFNRLCKESIPQLSPLTGLRR